MEQNQLSLFDAQPEKSDHYFGKKRSWSAAKHRVMLRYIQSFCYTLGGSKKFQSPILNYVDGFAGEGVYKEGIGIQDFVSNSDFWKKHKSLFQNTDGSPLIALKCAQIFQEERRVNLRSFFVEKKPDYHQELIRNCSGFKKKVDFKIYPPQSFETAIDQIFIDLQKYPTLFFLDVFGVKGVPFKRIQDIARYLSQHKGEMFILFHNSSIARQAGFLTGKPEDSTGRSPNDAMMQNLTDFLGENSENDWKEKWLELRELSLETNSSTKLVNLFGEPVSIKTDKNSVNQEFERWALKYFKKSICESTEFNGVISFPIKEKYSDSRPKYHIVVASNHPEKAFGEFINDFVWQEEKILFSNGENQPIDSLQKEWDRISKKRASEAKPFIIKILSQQMNWISVGDLITKVILCSQDIGLVRRSDYRTAIIDLYNQQEILGKKLGKTGLTLNSLVKSK